MRNRVLGLAALSLLALAICGCEDDAARKNIDMLTQQNQQLQQRVDDLERQVKAVNTNTNFDDVIDTKVAAKMEKVQADQNTGNAAVTAQIDDMVKMVQERMKALEAAQAQELGTADTPGLIQQQLKSMLADQVAQDDKKRAALKTDILGYINEQLRDMYPYAFKKQMVNEPRKISDEVDIP
ncbi:MAG: hypothetical protein ACREJ2_03980 [Planctomycetota bacterium]